MSEEGREKSARPSDEARAFGRLSGQDLSGKDFSSAELSRATFSRCVMAGTDFRKAAAVGAQFDRARLRNCNLSGAFLAAADFRDARLDHADFQGAVAPGLQCAEAELVSCVLKNARLHGANFEFARIEKCDLSAMEAPGATFLGSTISACDLSGALLAGANFSDASLSGVNLVGADCSFADFNHANLKGMDFERTKVAGARFWMCSGLDAKQKESIRSRGGSLRSPLAEKYARVGSFLATSRAAQAVMVLLLLLAGGHVTRYFVDPQKMSVQRLLRLADDAGQREQFEKVDRMLHIALGKKDLSEGERGQVLLRLSWHYGRIGDHSKARETLERIISTSTDSGLRSNAILSLAETEWAMGNAEKAMGYYRGLIEDPTVSAEDHSRALLEMLEKRIEEKKYSDALQWIKTVEQQFRGYPGLQEKLHLLKAAAYDGLGRRGDAIEQYRAAVEASSDPGLKFWNRLRLAELEYADKAPDEKRKAYQEILKSADQPEHRSRMQLELARLDAESGETERAHDLYEKVIENTRDEGVRIEARSRLADMVMRSGEFEKAATLYEAIWNDYGAKKGELGRAAAQALLQCARLRADMGNLETGEALVRKVLSDTRDEPTRVQALTQLAEFERRRGRPDEALKLYEQMPSDSHRLVQKARTYAEMGKTEKSEELYRQALESTDDEHERLMILTDLAHLALSSGRKEEAFRQFEAIWERGRDRGGEQAATAARARGQMAQLHAEAGRSAEARKTFHSLLRNSPSDEIKLEIQGQLAALEIREGRPEKALEIYEEMRTGGRQPRFAVLQIARLKQQLGQAEESRELFEDYLQGAVNPQERMEAQLGLAGLAMKAGRTDEAVRMYETVWKSGRGKEGMEGVLSEQALFQLTMALVDSGNVKPATKYFEILLRESKDEHMPVVAGTRLADLEMQGGRIENALDIYERLRRAGGEERGFLILQIARIKNQLGRPRESEKLYEEFLRGPGNQEHRVEAQLGLADIAFAEGRRDQAAREYARIWRENEGKSGQVGVLAERALFQLAQLHAGMGRPDLAVPVFERLARQAGDTGILFESRVRLVESMMDQGRWDKAELYYKELAQPVEVRHPGWEDRLRALKHRLDDAAGAPPGRQEQTGAR